MCYVCLPFPRQGRACLPKYRVEIQKLSDANIRFAEETDRRAASQGHLHSPLRHTACIHAPIDLVMSVSPT